MLIASDIATHVVCYISLAYALFMQSKSTVTLHQTLLPNATILVVIGIRRVRRHIMFRVVNNIV